MQRLALSIQKYNRDQIPFYLSVPAAEMELFKAHLSDTTTHLISDESIVAASPRIDNATLRAMPGNVSQQVVKSEFWRLGLCQSYVCLDSDAIFIRPFTRADFLATDGVPYTMIDEAHDLLEAALHKRRNRIVNAFYAEAAELQTRFGRKGRTYSFGPFPVVWHRAVWESLDTQYLIPRNMSLADAIAQAPIESRWYGEALLAYKAIPIIPCQALFKVYHYAWQYDKDRSAGIDNDVLALMYCGVLYQSSWERDLDWPKEGGHILSRGGRRLRRWLGRI